MPFFLDKTFEKSKVMPQVREVFHSRAPPNESVSIIKGKGREAG